MALEAFPIHPMGSEGVGEQLVPETWWIRGCKRKRCPFLASQPSDSYNQHRQYPTCPSFQTGGVCLRGVFLPPCSRLIIIKWGKKFMGQLRVSHYCTGPYFFRQYYLVVVCHWTRSDVDRFYLNGIHVFKSYWFLVLPIILILAKMGIHNLKFGGGSSSYVKTV